MTGLVNKRLASVVIAVAATALIACSCASKNPGTGKLPSAEICGMHLQPKPAEQYEQVFAQMQDLGVRWVRWSTHWATIEPNPGAYDWSGLDAIVAGAAKHNMKLLVTLRAISLWGSVRVPVNTGRSGYHAASPPKDMGRYSAWVTAVTARYAGKVGAWQIENEPNAKAFWDGTTDEYVSLLTSGYAAAHRGDPNAVVLAAGLACGFSSMAPADVKRESLGEWFNAILDSKSYDALDLHDYYPPSAGNQWGLTFGQYIGWAREWMKAKGVTSPLWMSEAGISSEAVRTPTITVGFTPAQQAADLKLVYSQAAVQGISHVFWIKLLDSPEAAFTNMGLFTQQRQKKPAWQAYRDLTTR
ncbi:MAG: beta-galactosidase [Candidatus Geothermincolia bacterium]